MDVGCGGGKFVKELSDRGVDITGIDIANPSYALDSGEDSEDYTLDKNDLKNGLFVKTGADKTPFKDEEFDTVFSSLSVLFEDYEDSDYQTKVMEEIKRVLKPGGKIYLFGRNSEMENICKVVGGLSCERINKEKFTITKESN